MIYWYENDKRFEPGTVADHEYMRFILRQVEVKKKKVDKWRLYISIRTHKDDGVEDDLKRELKVAEFKNCESLKAAQNCAEEWLNKFKRGIIF